MAEMVNEGAATSEVLAILQRQTSALERLVALTAVSDIRSTEGFVAVNMATEVPDRPASAIDHRWERQLAKQPMVMESNVTIMSLEGVDTANHTFSANIVAEFHVWYPGDVHDFDPKIKCSNLKETSTEPMMSQYECPDGSYCFRRQWHGTFLEHLELVNFPMDIQDLSFEFVSEWPADRVKFIKSRTYESKTGGGLGIEVIRDAWDPTMIWEAKNMPVLSHKLGKKLAILVREDVTEGAGMQSGVLHPTISFTLQVRRHATNYLYNIIAPTAVLTSLAFCSFTVPLNEVADRASITLTLLLSIIAYKLIIKDELPKVNFLTLIDVYILASMTVIGMIVFANSAVGHAVEEVTSEIRRRDYECRLVLGILWVVSNLIFLVRIAFRMYIAGHRIRAFKRDCSDGRDRSSEVLLLV